MGVIDSDATPRGCWAHFSAIVIDGYKELAPSGSVTFTFEQVEQDGYRYRAVTVWPSSTP
jgi:cold shock protein